MAASLNGIVINEILTTPRDGRGGFDTDGNGVTEPNDEFVELFNTTGSDVDISGWTIEDGESTYTFPAGTVIPAGEHIVVINSWDGSTPPSYVYESGIQLENTGDEVILSDGTGAIAAFYNGGGNLADIPFKASINRFGRTRPGQSLQRDPDGSDNIVAAAPNPECFVTGTLIATGDGTTAVEALKIGDWVQTAEGQLKAIKWIGRQTVTPETVQNPMRGYPILVKAGALGNSLPVRDLYVSPDHALLVDGLLINAGALVNSISILQTEPTETFTYFHVELDNHALLIAEGTYAESYLPQKEDRDCYDNAAEYSELYPEGPSVMLWPLEYPRVSSYTAVPRYIRQRLEAIAHELCGEAVTVAV